MGAWRVVLVGALVLATLLQASQVVASHVAGHAYSIAVEKSGGATYTAVSVSRPVPNYLVPCGMILYQSVWSAIDFASGGDWVELGTWHQCNGNRAHYWGAAANGVWAFHGYTYAPVSAGNVVFKIEKGTDHVYRYYINGAQKTPSYADTRKSLELHVGLETYVLNGSYAAVNYAGLVYRTNYGALTFWSGRDGVDIDADMGGQWISDSSWRAWQQ